MRSYRYHFALDSQIGSEMYTDLKDLIFDGYLEFGTVLYYLPNCICIFCQKITCLSQFPEDIPDMQKLVTSMICHAEELFKVYTHN